MKKILGISLVAVLAATPMMARAGDVTLFTEQEVTGSALTTQAYVKGAYNELGGVINTKADDADLTAEVERATLAETGLQSAINTLNGDVSTPGSVSKKIADAISTVDTTTSGLTERVSTLESNDATKVGVVSTIKAATINVADNKTVSSTVNGNITTTDSSITVANSWNDATDTSTVRFLTGADKGTLSVATTLGGTITAEIDDDSVVYPVND